MKKVLLMVLATSLFTVAGLAASGPGDIGSGEDKLKLVCEFHNPSYPPLEGNAPISIAVNLDDTALGLLNIPTSKYINKSRNVMVRNNKSLNLIEIVENADSGETIIATGSGTAELTLFSSERLSSIHVRCKE